MRWFRQLVRMFKAVVLRDTMAMAELKILRKHRRKNYSAQLQVGDRVNIYCPNKYGDVGTGTVVHVGTWEMGKERLENSIKVKFDKMPEHTPWCSQSEVYWVSRIAP